MNKIPGVNKGKKFSKKWRENLSKGHKGLFLRESHPRWAGDKAKYSAYHEWLRRTYGRANKCENLLCSKKSNNYHWALLKGREHSHKRANYCMLCVSCHKLYDKYNYEITAPH